MKSKIYRNSHMEIFFPSSVIERLKTELREEA